MYPYGDSEEQSTKEKLQREKQPLLGTESQSLEKPGKTNSSSSFFIKKEKDAYDLKKANSAYRLHFTTQISGGFPIHAYNAPDRKKAIDTLYNIAGDYNQPDGFEQNLKALQEIYLNCNTELDNIFSAYIPYGHSKEEAEFLAREYVGKPEAVSTLQLCIAANGHVGALMHLARDFMKGDRFFEKNKDRAKHCYAMAQIIMGRVPAYETRYAERINEDIAKYKLTGLETLRSKGLEELKKTLTTLAATHMEKDHKPSWVITALERPAVEEGTKCCSVM